MFRTLYWKIHDAIWRYRINRYKTKEPRIYYVSKYHEWTHPIDPQHYVSPHIEDVIGDITGVGLVYEYLIDGEWCHQHTFGEVLKEAYNRDEEFRIPRSVVDDYSDQELNLLKAAIQASVHHRHLTNKDGTLIVDDPIEELN